MLIITVKKEISPSIGALGRMKFTPGMYAYVGSAQSNLEHRKGRHLGKNRQSFWHIDYLLNDNATEISKVFVKNADRTEECAVSDTLKAIGESVERFGSSDCSCKSHLFHIKDHEFLSGCMHVFYKQND